MKRPTQAWREAGLFENGLGMVMIARFKANGDAEAGIFLVDMHCLGVKNASFFRLSAAEFEGRLRYLFHEQTPVDMPPTEARALVEAAVVYARKLGLEPHPDYRLGQRVFGGIDAGASTATFTFGKDGKPLYVQGPNDAPEFADFVMNRLRTKCGEGNFDFILAVGGDEDALA